MDKCTRAVIWADAKDSTILRVEMEKLGNTKITSNDIAQKGKRDASKGSRHFYGKRLCIPFMVQSILGYSNVLTNIYFEVLCTLPYEYRGASKVNLDRNGNVIEPERLEDVPEAVCELSDSYIVRAMKLGQDRQFTDDQRLLMQSSEYKYVSTDKVTLYGLRPPELIQLIRRLGLYYEWFYADSKPLGREEIENGLDDDVRKCMWIDGIGRRIRIRKCASASLVRHLEGIDACDVSECSVVLRDHLLTLLRADGVNDSLFVYDDGHIDTPTVVYSKINPKQNMKFIHHVLLVLGEYDTELDFKRSNTVRETFYNARLFPPSLELAGYNENSVVPYITNLVINEIIPLQPVGIRTLDDYIPDIETLFQSVLTSGTIPVRELPSCLATTLVEVKGEEIRSVWTDYKSSQLKSMTAAMVGNEDFPGIDVFRAATKSNPVSWTPLNLDKLPRQSTESYQEQKFAIRLGVESVNDFLDALGSNRLAKGVLYNGAPGAGKTFVLQCVGMYAIGLGLNVMSSSLMGIRAVELGGLNLHQLVKFPRKKGANLFRMAQVSVMLCLLCL